MNSLDLMRSPSQSPGRICCPPRLFGGGIGMKYELTRRVSAISPVIPSSEKTKCRRGSSYGELRMGFSISTSGMPAPRITLRFCHQTPARWNRLSSDLIHLRAPKSAAVAVNLAVTTRTVGGDGWESNPPRTPQQRPANGFEDRGRHQPPIIPSSTARLALGGES